MHISRPRFRGTSQCDLRPAILTSPDPRTPVTRPVSGPKSQLSCWNVANPELIVYVECDRSGNEPPGIVDRVRINGRELQYHHGHDRAGVPA